MAKCPSCNSENRAGSKFCDSCGTKLDAGGAQSGLKIAPPHTDDSPAAPSGPDDGSADSMEGEGVGWPDAPSEPEGSGDAAGDEDAEAPAEPEPAAETDEGTADPFGEPAEADSSWDSGDSDAEATEGEAEPEEEPKAGYLVFPDSTEQQVPPSQWLIGRADLAKFLRDPKKANEISRGHLTVFQDDGKFFIEDGKTMVQDKPSTNKTWVLRGGTRILVTGTGRNELQDADEIDVAELVKLQFVVK